MAPAGALALKGMATKCVFPIGAAIEHVGAHRIGEFTVGDCVGGAGGIEGEGNIGLAVGEKLAHGASILRKRPALTPQEGMKLIQIGEKGRAERLEIRVRHGPFELGRIGRELGQRLLQEGGAVKIGRLRVGEASRMRLGPVKQRRHGFRRLLDACRVVHEHELRHSPGGFQPVGWQR